ncbi:PfkB family carbohydrate kinase [Neobacillus sp. SuZ13]|uniref:PfkB family carbohydrate kinase n=1 Tax=Neobacillus sp. SuZ13 TaxID=3047875 RepID=UPI0024C08ACE|nr:PfkB family carbohydrate kinase [Neobacillus sp. SuZ13]WHY68097.1 PfkB family carbohydrate kinase [Neobacillus sp. SuZ13]
MPVKNRSLWSLSLTDEPARPATFEAIKQAKDIGKIISFDPNYRRQLWKCEHHAKELMKKGLLNSDIVKLSEEEFHLLVGEMEFLEGTDYLVKEYQLSLLFVTLGNEGCLFRKGKAFGKISGYNVKAVDTTGAGDAFLGFFNGKSGLVAIFTHHDTYTNSKKPRHGKAMVPIKKLNG